MSDDENPLQENDATLWYRDGYKLGSVETKRDAAIPRLIGAGVLFGGALWDPLVTGTFLVFYAGFTLLDYRDRRAEAKRLREQEPKSKFNTDDGGDQ
jgi:hypothetical protein